MRDALLRAYPHPVATRPAGRSALRRNLVVGAIGFLTLVDLFAAQAILPTLVAAYGVSPAEMGFAVNASTFGMAAASLGIALVAGRIERRTGIWISLALLTIPTAALAVAPSLTVFLLLRIVQGLFMAAAFALTMAYLAERCSAEETRSALAAYVTGVVASNLVGRLVSSAAAGAWGLEATFLIFAGLNASGALLVLANLEQMRMEGRDMAPRLSALASWRLHLSSPALRAANGIGFVILFVFVGVFTYVNFTLTAPPLSLSQMSLGAVYLVFLPALLTTPLAGRFSARTGSSLGLRLALGLALLGLPLLLLPSLPLVLAGLVLVGVGTFLAQAIATGFVGQAAQVERAAASGLYLASYYLGGLAGAFLLGRLLETWGWAACVAAVAVALGVAIGLAGRLEPKT